MTPVSISDVNVIIKKSEEFAKKNKLGSTTTTMKELQAKGIEDSELLLNANSAYPIIHHRVHNLIINFIKLKQKCGSNVEKLVYKASMLEVFNFSTFNHQDISVVSFIDRLIAKRPLVFVGPLDAYILRDQVKLLNIANTT